MVEGNVLATGSFDGTVTVFDASKVSGAVACNIIVTVFILGILILNFPS